MIPSQNLMAFFTHQRVRLILLLWIYKEHIQILQQNMNRYFPETEVIKEGLRHLLLSSKRSGWLKHSSLQLLNLLSVSIWQLLNTRNSLQGEIFSYFLSMYLILAFQKNLKEPANTSCKS